MIEGLVVDVTTERARAGFGGVFVNYRRGAHGHAVAAIRRELTTLFGVDKVFFDQESMPAGSRYPDRLREGLARSQVLVAVLHPSWVSDLRDPDSDWVQLEIATALAEHKTVIPVLLDDTSMPLPDELPAAIRDLAHRQACRLRWSTEHDMRRLVAEVWQAAWPRRHVLRRLALAFCGILTAFAAAWIAATPAGTAGALLAVGAGTAVGAAIWISTIRTPMDRHRKLATGGCAGAAAALAIACAAVTDDDPGPAQPVGSAAGPVAASSSHRLTLSSSVDTNDRDKIDLDTGCPGWGPTRLRVGPRRCGENADLILNETELSAWERLPRFALSPEPSPAECRKRLDAGATGSVQRDNLRAGSTICVQTDKGNVGIVRIEAMVDQFNIEISYEVWPSSQ